MAGDRNGVSSTLTADNSSTSSPSASSSSSSSSTISAGVRCPLCKRWIHLLADVEEQQVSHSTVCAAAAAVRLCRSLIHCPLLLSPCLSLLQTNVWLLLGHLCRTHPVRYERIRQQNHGSVQEVLAAAEAEARTPETDSPVASVTPVSDAISALIQQAPPLPPSSSSPPPSLLPSVFPFSRSLPSIVGGSGDPLQRYGLINDTLRELFDFSQRPTGKKEEKDEAEAEQQPEASAVEEKEEKAEQSEPVVKQEAASALQSAAALASAEPRDHRKRKLEYGSMREAVHAEMMELQTVSGADSAAAAAALLLLLLLPAAVLTACCCALSV